jgi:phospholipid/cholesterol/gamma-HCH transport system ATP-binding protein
MSADRLNQTSVGITVRGLKKSLGGQLVLRGLDFEIQPGELFVIMGPSGSGKTVLLRHLIGLETSDEGQILIDGESILTPGVMDKYRMAMVFQSGALLNSLTVEENVGLYLTEHRLKPPEDIARVVSEKLDLVGLKGTGDKMPSDLSGGMKKRVAIARALVIEPQLILYDEPTSELDPIIAATIGQEIVRLNRKVQATSVVVTHDRDLAFGVAHRMAILLAGEIRASGTPEEIRASTDPEVQELLTADFKLPN